MKFNYLIKVEYDGTNFVGWQHQKKGKTIQGEIEKVFKKILKKNVKIIGAGRTDKGVHAKGQFAHFKINEKIEDLNKFLCSINFFLSKKLISIISIKKKNQKFHSRYLAKERIYKYIIINRPSNLSLENNRAWHVRKKLDIRLMKRGAKEFIGKHDFSTYRSSSCSAKSALKDMNYVSVKKKKETITIIFKSQSFLQNQVRSMVGCLEYLGKKKWNLQKFIQVFKLKKRSLCAPPAPACGLYLLDVKY